MNRWSACLLWMVCCSLSLRPSIVWAISFDELLNSYGVLETVAGTALVTGGGDNGWDFSMEEGPAIDAELSRPHMAMADWLGNIYVADKDAHAIRLIAPDGIISTLAGTSTPGYNGDGYGPDVELNQPNGLYTFPNGTNYILDLGNSMIRKLSLDGQVSTIFEDPYGMTVGRGLWVSPDETIIYYASGTEVRRWTADEGVSIYADGFLALGNLTVDPSDGNVVATDREGHAVYKLFPGGGRQRIAGNESTSGGGSGFLAVDTGLKEVRGIQYHPSGGYLLATHDGGQVWFVDDDDVIHLLIDGDDNGTHWGDGLPLTTPGRKISEPRAVTLAPNGDLIVTEHDGGYIRHVASLDPWLIGDFDHDHILGETDIDALTLAVRGGHNPQTLDVTFDGQVDEQDRQTWIEQIRFTYLGDSNLDGKFSSEDLIEVLQRSEYEDDIPGNSGWGDGDWDGNGDFTSEDFIAALATGAYEQGPRLVPNRGVPEPAALTLVSCSWLVVLLCGRRSQLTSLARRRHTNG